jgi:alpha-beta hydrolase superfamily lysophospholipase
MYVRDVFFDAGDNQLVGTKILASDTATTEILSLHGAGESSRQRIRYLLEDLAEDGFSSFGFDFSGQGDSTGSRTQSSLASRLADAQAACRFMSLSNLRLLIGSSMGAHLAAILTKSIFAENLVLFCPAAYSKLAANACFNKEFSEIIRRPDSYIDSEAFDCIAEFSGNLLIVDGEKDVVIPSKIIDKYMKSAKSAATKEVLVIDGCGHQIHDWLKVRPTERHRVSNRIKNLLHPSTK